MGTTPDVVIDFGSLTSDAQSLWKLDRYNGPINTFGDYLRTKLEAEAIYISMDGCSVSDKGINLFSFNFYGFQARYFDNQGGYLAATIASVNTRVGITWEEDIFIGAELQATALTIGGYTKYVNLEFLIASIGATAKFDNGKLKIGFSFGIGIAITIKIW